ncbi:hypothetical protein GCM10009798_01080 [Nocardioides panacihumi]|uniref:CARDB domain-containing protein n=1 Tax=Nocardioides panacihumi TaxID=400774 RepID=A0ABN2Q6U6_9ACTN
MTNDLDTTSPRRAPSRRAVLRTAANAAWVVPAVQIATSVPAFASASNHATINLTVNSSSKSGKVGTINLTVSNNGIKTANGNSTASTVTLTFSGAGFGAVKTTSAGTMSNPSVVLTNVMVGAPQQVTVTVDLGKMDKAAKAYLFNVAATGLNAFDNTTATAGPQTSVNLSL